MDHSSTNVTTADIARHTGLSKMTVSRVLNQHPYVSEQTRIKVMAAVKELGFRPNTLARRFFTGKTRLIGLIIPLDYMLSSFYFKEMFLGIRQVLEEAGYDLLLHDSTSVKMPPFEKGLDLVKGKLAEGLLITAPLTYDDFPARLTKEGVPLVVMGETAQADKVNRITLPNHESSKQAVQDLLKAGHQRIAALVYGDQHVESLARQSGYLDALREAGITPDPALVISAGYNRLNAQEETARLLASRPEVTAIFAANADMALGASDAIRQQGLSIPGDVSLVSFDDCVELASHNPPISAVRQFPQQLGTQAARLLLELLGAPELPKVQCQIVGTEYVRRDSMAPPSARQRGA